MKRAWWAIPLLLLPLAGCGQGDGERPSADKGAPAGSVAGCESDDPQVTGAKEVANVDLDGDGTPDQVRLTSADAENCPSFLVVTLDGVTSGARVVDDGQPLTGATYQAVTVPGRTGQLLAVRTLHPRGGYQEHLFVADQGKLAQVLTEAGEAPFGFVATDTNATFAAVRCGENRLLLLRAVRHRPIGVIPAWDIERTPIAIDGSTATPGATREIADNVLYAQLPKRFPDVAANTWFVTGCSAS